MAAGQIAVSVSDGCATISFSHPGKRNAFTGRMFAQLRAAILEAGADSQVRVVVLTGGGGAFTSGIDTAFFDQPRTARRLKAGIEENVQLVARVLEDFDKPVIAAVDGPAVGAGMDLACMADFRLASTRAVFITGYIRLGLAPGGGGAHLLPRIVGESTALELLLTNRRLEAEEALRIGLVSSVVEPEDLPGAVAELVASLTEWDLDALRLTKRAVRASRSLTFRAALDLASSHAAVLADGGQG